MKKTIVLITLGFLLVFGVSMSIASDTPTQQRGNGLMIKNNVNSPEEALAMKIERIDRLVTEGKITAEKAVEFKKTITERMSNCDGTADRGSKERLGIGFGRSEGKGQHQGQGLGQKLGQRLGNR